jgi:hypothetical protein
LKEAIEMITIPSNATLLLAATSVLVLMVCQWVIGGVWLRNRRAPTVGGEPRTTQATTEYRQEAA